MALPGQGDVAQDDALAGPAGGGSGPQGADRGEGGLLVDGDAGAGHRGRVLRDELEGAGAAEPAGTAVGPLGAGQDQQEGGAVGRPPPGREAAAVQTGILHGDGQPQSGASKAALARGVGAVEAVEDLGDDVGAHADAVVAHPHRHRIGIHGDGDVHRLALTVLERVDHEVADDALDPGDVDLRGGRLLGEVEAQLGAGGVEVELGGLDDGVDHLGEVDLLQPELDVPGVDAGDVQQVGEHGLEAVHRAGQDLDAAQGEGIGDLLARVLDLLRGQADRGQRGAQLVGDVGDEEALHLGQGLQALDLVLQRGRHVVEGSGQGGYLVLPLDAQPLGQQSGGQTLSGPGGVPHGAEHPPGEGPHHDDEDGQEAQPPDGDVARGQGDDALLAGQAVDEVEVVLPCQG